MDENNTHVHHEDDSNTHEESSKSNAMLWVGVAVIALLLVGGILMSRKTSPATQNTNTTMEESNTTTDTSLEGQGDFNDTEGLENVQEEQPEDGTSMEAGVVSVEGGMFYFKPNEIRVKKGETVKVAFNNSEGMHDFVIDELNVRTPIIKAGESAEVEFTVDEVGEFEFYCSVGNHRQQGMTGTLIVEE